jgi:hypothetical protein
MRLRLSKLLVLGVLASALLATAASAAITGFATGMSDTAVGGFRGVGGVNDVAFSAHSDPNGANPYGHLSQTIPAGKTSPQRQDRFDVTCLAVDGNHAAIGLTPSNSETATRFPSGRVLIVIDNGNPQSGQTVDTYGYRNGTNNCEMFRTDVVTNLPETGDTLVHDEL